MISRDIMDVNNYSIEIKHHVFIRAMERGISPDLIEDTIKNGKIEHFAKDRVRFIKIGSKRTIICIGEIRGMTITIFTIERKG